jgi:hypothetical protein
VVTPRDYLQQFPWRRHPTIERKSLTAQGQLAKDKLDKLYNTRLHGLTRRHRQHNNTQVGQGQARQVLHHKAPRIHTKVHTTQQHTNGVPPDKVRYKYTGSSGGREAPVLGPSFSPHRFSPPVDRLSRECTCDR